MVLVKLEVEVVLCSYSGRRRCVGRGTRGEVGGTSRSVFVCGDVLIVVVMVVVRVTNTHVIIYFTYW